MRVRWLTSLLLGAGILGCSSVPMRDTAVASYVDDADGVEFHAIDYEEPTESRRTASPSGGAPRARLHIPYEYISQLNWDPEAFMDDEEPESAVTESVEVEREEEVSAPRRSQWRRSHGNRRGRRSGRRRFRTVGISMSISRGGGHPVGLPGHSIGVPGQAVGVPGQAVGRPAQSVGIPGQAVGLPGQAVRIPGHAVRRPGHAVKLPGQAVTLPGQAVSLPQHPVGLPGHSVGVPGHSVRSVPPRSKSARKKSKQR